MSIFVPIQFEKRRHKFRNRCYTQCYTHLVGSSGEVNNDQLQRNMLDAVDAVDVYISRVGAAPCGDTTIQLFPGKENSMILIIVM